MGCWNETCLISRLPILSGDPCYGLILHRERFYNATYSNSMWSAESPIVEGYYDDYGSLDGIQVTAEAKSWAKLVLADLKAKKLKPSERTEDHKKVVTVHDIFQRFSSSDFKDERAPSKDIHAQDYYVALFHKRIFDALYHPVTDPKVLAEEKQTAFYFFRINNLGSPRFQRLLERHPTAGRKVLDLLGILSGLRTPLEPPTGKGSQCTEHKPYDELIRAMKPVLQDIRKANRHL